MTNAWPQTIRCWDSTWDALAKDFDLVAYDMPGFGFSEGRSDLMRPSAQADFAVRLLDALELDRVHGIGPDVGVPAFLSLAQRYPDRVESLTVFDGPGTGSPAMSASLRLVVVSSLARAATAPFGRMFAWVAMRQGYRRHRPSIEALGEYRECNGDRSRFGRTLEYLGSYSSELPKIEAGLSEMKVPVLVLWGADDPFLPPRNAAMIAGPIPHSETEVLSGCGHFMHEDADTQFVERVRKWCSEIERA